MTSKTQKNIQKPEINLKLNILPRSDLFFFKKKIKVKKITPLIKMNNLTLI